MDYISEIKMSHWKYFSFGTPIPLKPGINLLLGKNGSGKTSLLEMVQGASANQTQPIPSSATELDDGTRLVSINIKSGSNDIVISNEKHANEGRWSVNTLNERVRFITSSRTVNSGNSIKNPFASSLAIDTTISIGQTIDVAEEFNKAIIKELIDVIRAKMESGADFLDVLQDEYQKELIDFEKKLRIDPTKENAVYFIDHKDREVPINNLSSGEKEYLYFYAYLRKIKNDENKIILIDEPELHLHSSQIRKLCELIANLAVKNQIIIATHSGEILQHFISYANLLLISKDTVEHIADSDQMRKILEETGLPTDPSVFTAHWICAEGEPTKTLCGNGPTTPEVLGWIFGSDIKKRYWSFGSNRALAKSYGTGIAVAISATGSIDVTPILDGDKLVNTPNDYMPIIPEPTRALAYFPFWEIENIFLMPSLLDRVIPSNDGKTGSQIFWQLVETEKESLLNQVKKTITKNSLRNLSPDKHIGPNTQNDYDTWKGLVHSHNIDLNAVNAKFEQLITNKDWRWIPGKEALALVVQLEPALWNKLRDFHQNKLLKEIFETEEEVKLFMQKISTLE